MIPRREVISTCEGIPSVEIIMRTYVLYLLYFTLLYFTYFTLLYRPANGKLESLKRLRAWLSLLTLLLYFTVQGLKTEGRMAEGWRLIVDDG